MSEAIGTKAYPGALYDPNSGHVHPGKLVGMFKAAAESAGVQIFEATPIIHVEEGERLTLRMASGKSVHARSLVLATNAFTSKLA